MASCAMPSTRGCAPTRSPTSDAPAPRPRRQVERKRYVTDADLAQIWVTNPDRVMFGKGGPSKLELALYYARVGDWMLPELISRPVSLVRCPTGKGEDCFFQRHALAGMPEVVKTIPLPRRARSRPAEYLYLEDARGLLSLAQFGAVEFHSWGCRVDQPERPDRIVFDLDPDEGLPWREVVERRLRGARRRCAELGLVPFLKTTGGKGLHVVVPLARRQGWEPVRALLRGVRAADGRRRRRAASPPTWPRRSAAGGSTSTICATSAAPPRSPPTRCARARACRPRRRSPGTSSAPARRPGRSELRYGAGAAGGGASSIPGPGSIRRLAR